MYQLEGLFSYWKGILPPILAETPKRATKFVCFEQYKRFFMFGSEKATPLVILLSFIFFSTNTYIYFYENIFYFRRTL